MVRLEISGAGGRYSQERRCGKVFPKQSKTKGTYGKTCGSDYPYVVNCMSGRIGCWVKMFSIFLFFFSLNDVLESVNHKPRHFLRDNPIPVISIIPWLFPMTVMIVYFFQAWRDNNAKVLVKYDPSTAQPIRDQQGLCIQVKLGCCHIPYGIFFSFTA